MTALSRVLAQRAGITPARCRVQVLKDQVVPVAEGISLLCDVHLPRNRTEKTPVLLVRSPYGRRGKWGFMYGTLLAERGVISVVQSTRGGYGSGGRLEPMVHDYADGHATVSWLRTQPWWTGRLILAGASYQAWCAWSIAQDPPAELVGLISHVGPHQWRDVHRPGGSLAIETLLAWTADQLGPERPDGLIASARRSSKSREIDLAALLAPLPLRASVDRLLGGQAPSWFHDWLDHPPTSEYWDSYDATAALEKVDVPVLIMAGWDDLFVEQAWHQARRLDSRGVPVHLVVGPWTHRGLQAAWPEVIDRTVRWLDDLDTREHSSAELFTTRSTNGGSWRSGPIAEPTRYATWVLSGDALQPDTVPAAAATRRTWVYNPTDPTPQVGGATMTNGAGRRDQAQVEKRSDVLTFTSPPLTAPVDVLGAGSVTLDLELIASPVDIVVRVCDVDEEGVSTLLTDTISHADSAESAVRTLQLPPLGHVFEKGHRIRLHVAGGGFPRWARPIDPDGGTERAAPTTQVLRSAPASPSALVLPVRS